MPSTPKNKFKAVLPGPVFRPWQVRTSDIDPLGNGAPPTLRDETLDLKAIRLVRTSGGQTLDYCELEVDLSRMGRRLQDLFTPSDFGQQLTVVTEEQDGTGSATYDLLFWGEFAGQTIQLNASTERAMVLARVDKHHFGEPLTHYNSAHLQDDVAQVFEVHNDIIFNPEIDGIIEGNRSDLLLNEDNEVISGIDLPSGDDFHGLFFIDPDSTRSESALDWQSQYPEPWTLWQAVHAICWLLNPDERFIKNPAFRTLRRLMPDTLSALNTDTPDEDKLTPPLENVRIPRGWYLPEALDALLTPYGYSWYLAIREPQLADEDEEEDNANLQLQIYRQGEGVEKKLYYQAPGQSLDLTKSNATDLGVTWNIADLANRIVAQGSLIEKEITVELYRAWAEEDDDLTADQLKKSDTGSQYLTKPLVWRKWVLNEGGDYNGLRTSVRPIPDVPFDLSQIFLDPDTGDEIRTARRCRRFLDCLTWTPHDTPHKRRKPVLEYSSDGTTWLPFPGDDWHQTSWDILETECGILLIGDTPCPELIALGDNARLRITATVRADQRLTATAEREVRSPNVREITLFLDVSDRYHYRQLQAAGDYKSQFETGGGIFAADVKNDLEDLQEYVEKVRHVAETARIETSIQLLGIVTAYEIGDLITSVDGRNISFNRYAADTGEYLYLQVTGLVWDRQAQTTTLYVTAIDRKVMQKAQD